MLKPGQGHHSTVPTALVKCWSSRRRIFEDFLQPRPDLPQGMEDELERVVRHLVEHRWPFRLHTTYDESISRMLDVFEKVNRDIPFNGLHWFFDHAETITERNIERVKALGGGIAVQHRMAFQGEYFVDRYGKEAVKHTPPVAKMLELDVPVVWVPMRPASPVITRGPRCTGWFPDVPSAAWRCTTITTVCRATSPLSYGPPVARGSQRAG